MHEPGSAQATLFFSSFYFIESSGVGGLGKSVVFFIAYRRWKRQQSALNLLGMCVPAVWLRCSGGH